MADTALSMTTLHPLPIRYTCKQTLLQDPKFGWLVRGIKSIGIKRKQDYKNKNVDNSHAFDAVYKELSKDCIVGMYPEGVGKYKSSLSPFRTGLARMAINFIIKYPHKSIHILPVALNYLHREKFRSSANVRIGKPIFLNSDIIKDKRANAKDLDLSSDDIYKMGKEITNELTHRFDDLVISAPNWKMVKLAHLARTIAFPESSSPKRTFLTHYIDLARQFNEIFRDKLSDELVAKCYDELNRYWKLLWSNGLKDYRVLQMSKSQRNHDINSRCWRKFSLLIWFLYRFLCGVFLITLSMPGMISLSPIYFLWQYLRKLRIRKGIEGNFDGLAMNKMAMFTYGIPLLCIMYAYMMKGKYGWRNGVLFGILYPLIAWISVRLYQDGIASMRNAYSLLKILFMRQEKGNCLIECRRNLSDLLLRLVVKYDIGCDDKIMSEEDRMNAPMTKRANMNWIARWLRGRIKKDWNETIKLYDVPTDEFHIHNS